MRRAHGGPGPSKPQVRKCRGGRARHEGIAHGSLPRSLVRGEIFFYDLRQAKIEDFYLVPLRDEDVGRLDVAMNDALGVRRLQSRRNLKSKIEHLIRGQRLLLQTSVFNSFL